MTLHKHKRYKITFDSSVHQTSGSTPSADVDIPVLYVGGASNYNRFRCSKVTLSWINYVANLWNVSRITATYIGGGQTTMFTPFEIIPSEELYIPDSNLFLSSGAIVIEEIETTFSLYFIKNDSEPERVDKQNFLTYVKNATGTLRESSSIVNPQITFEWDDSDLEPEFQNMSPSFNYVYIPQFGRFYFVNNITFMANNLWLMNLSCDVLMSYRSEILTNNAEIERQENDYNEDLIDDQRMVENGYDVEIVDTNVPEDNIFNVTTDDQHYPDFGIVLGVFK